MLKILEEKAAQKKQQKRARKREKKFRIACILLSPCAELCCWLHELDFRQVLGQRRILAWDYYSLSQSLN